VKKPPQPGVLYMHNQKTGEMQRFPPPDKKPLVRYMMNFIKLIPAGRRGTIRVRTQIAFRPDRLPVSERCEKAFAVCQIGSGERRLFPMIAEIPAAMFGSIRAIGAFQGSVAYDPGDVIEVKVQNTSKRDRKFVGAIVGWGRAE
jgi:hypothetical protein